MYNPQGYQQHPQHRSPPINTRTPPPLQHPVPQHPIPNFNQGVHQASPHMAQQQQQYQQQQHTFPPHPQGNYGPNMGTPPQPPQHPGNMYQFSGLNDPTAQIGMQFAGSAVAQGTAYVERNVSWHLSSV